MPFEIDAYNQLVGTEDRRHLVVQREAAADLQETIAASRLRYPSYIGEHPA
jgi:hypothetical protein